MTVDQIKIHTNTVPYRYINRKDIEIIMLKTILPGSKSQTGNNINKTEMEYKTTTQRCVF